MHEDGNWFSGYTKYSDYQPTIYKPNSSAYAVDNTGVFGGLQKQGGDLGTLLWRNAVTGNSPFRQFMNPNANLPSAAESQMRTGVDQASQAIAGSMYGNRSIPPALAARLAAQNTSQSFQRENQDAAVLRAQEAANQRNLAFQAANSDVARQANANNALQSWLGAQMGWGQNLEQMKAGQSNLYNQLMMQQDMANAGQTPQGGWGGALFGGLTSLASGGLAALAK